MTREGDAAPAGESRAAKPDVFVAAAVLVTVLLWGSAFVGIRAAGEEISPGALALGRLLVGSLILGVVVLARGERLPRRRDLPALIVCGLLWFALYNVALNAAEQRVAAGTAAMLVNVGPILIAVSAGILLSEGFPRQLLAGCAVAFVGVAIIGGATSETGLSPSAGALLCWLAACAYAGGMVMQKFILRRVSVLQTTFLCCLVGVVACLPFAPSLADDIGSAQDASVAWMIYLGAFPTGVAFTTWAYALARTDAGRLGATTYLVPPVSVVLAWALLGETPPALALLGGGLCLVGVALARGRLRRAAGRPR